MARKQIIGLTQTSQSMECYCSLQFLGKQIIFLQFSYFARLAWLSSCRIESFCLNHHCCVFWFLIISYICAWNWLYWLVALWYSHNYIINPQLKTNKRVERHTMHYTLHLRRSLYHGVILNVYITYISKLVNSFQFETWQLN